MHYIAPLSHFLATIKMSLQIKESVLENEVDKKEMERYFLPFFAEKKVKR